MNNGVNRLAKTCARRMRIGKNTNLSSNEQGCKFQAQTCARKMRIEKNANLRFLKPLAKKLPLQFSAIERDSSAPLLLFASRKNHVSAI
mmetsp:Transcript_2256/g.2887  ORF Transcript_2256/g.2887 Transcript_2256/m.2887 type:complete len:89 (+) Transcript_2256:1336-1602(+)